MSDKPDLDVDSSVLVVGGAAILLFGIAIGAVYVQGGFGLSEEPEPDFDFPDGASTDSLNTTVFADVHNNTLQNSTYTLQFQAVTERGRRTVNNRRVYAYGGNAATVTDALNGGTSERYILFENSTSFSRTQFNNNTTYSQAEVVRPPFTASNYLSQRVGVLKNEFVNTTTIDNTKVAVYNITGVKDSAQINASQFSVSGDIYIAENGYVKQLRLNITSIREGGASATQFLYIDDVNVTTVTEPSWVSTARANTSSNNSTSTNTTSP